MARALYIAAALGTAGVWLVMSPFGSGTPREDDTCSEHLCVVEITRTCNESQNPRTATIAFTVRSSEKQTRPVSYQIRNDVADKLPFMSIGANISIAGGIVQPGERRQESISTDRKTDVEITISTQEPAEEVASYTLSVKATCA